MKIEKCPFCGKEVAEISNCQELEGCRHFERCPATEPYVCVVCNMFEGGCGASSGYYDSEAKAIAAWNRRAEPENNPLTLDELRQMEGEPVWCEYINFRGERRGGKWCICEVIYGNIQPMADYAVGGTDTSTLCYGKTWLAYRAKPERSEYEQV